MYFICYHDAGIAFRSFSSGGIMADKRGGSLRSRVEQSIGFVVIRSGHKKDVKRTRKCSDTRKCRKEFLKYIMGFSEKHRVISSKRLFNTKVILGWA